MTMTSIPASSASPPKTSAAVRGLQPSLRSAPGWSAHAMGGPEMAPAIDVRGPEMAPHTPQRSARPGEAVARLDNQRRIYRGRSAIP